MRYSIFSRRGDSEEFYNLAGYGRREEVEIYLRRHSDKIAHLLKTPSKKLGLYPLDKAMRNITTHDYSVAGLLLEYGADPHARSPGPYYAKGSTQVHEAIQGRNLGKLRFLVFSKPDYKGVLGAKDETAYKALCDWASSSDAVTVVHKFKRWTVIDITEQTAEASIEIERLSVAAKEAETGEQYLVAIRCYQQLQSIYRDQVELEKVIPYPSVQVAKELYIDKKQHYMISYYESKRRHYHRCEVAMRHKADEEQDKCSNPLLI